MSDSKGSLCITCGQPTGGAPRLNTLSSGQACPTCRDRLLESLPSLLPGETEVPEPLEASEVSEASMMLDEFEQEVEPPAPAESTPKGPSRLLRGETPNEPA